MSSVRSLWGNARTIPLTILNDLELLENISRYADPFQVGWVNTSEIEYITGREGPNKFAWADAGLVLEGDWDQTTVRFEENSEWYEALVDRFVHGKEWENISAIQKRIEMVEKGETVMDGRESIQGVYDRCRLLDKIFKYMSNKGYKEQPILEKEGRGNPYNKILPYKNRYHEIAVDVGRNGELLFVDGKHRLSMAKILDIDRVPVRIVVRHKEFMKKDIDLNMDPPVTNYGHPLFPTR
ncbi:hypothetical protein [Natronococcus sp. A-GB7]|uniref:hypothetical protein n=1 Tax=Natronococcus sp. A-GB7 TaxID=3037649 RepID=UPI00241E839D|nr:hypothetical protein [Natronococcus sp. A-GB7]MDG5821323.1 hypothetical protein [Natronococcus sp. A-GB7]